MTSPAYDPWRHLAQFPDVALSVQPAPLENGAWAWTDFERRTITLSDELDGTEARCTLAHELVHLERGPVTGSIELVRIEESIADTVAALRLVPLCELPGLVERVEREGELAVAAALGVDEFIVRAAIRFMCSLAQESYAPL